MTSGSKPARRSRLSTFLLVVFAGLLLFYIVTCVRIVRQSSTDEARSADAIVVFGAAEYYVVLRLCTAPASITLTISSSKSSPPSS